MLEPLKNRLEIIHIPSYIDEEKYEIASKYLIPSLLKESNIPADKFALTEEQIRYIIKGWCCREGGVRELKRCLEKLSRKLAVQVLSNEGNLTETDKEQVEINWESFKCFDKGTIKNLLGPPILDVDLENRQNTIFKAGVSNALATSGFMGSILTVECIEDCFVEGKGDLTSTGNLSKVMQESIKIARLVAHTYLTEEQLKGLSKKNFHLHFFEASSEKDGPSAGTAICTAYLSTVLKIPLSPSMAMTGELTLKGNVNAIGGIQAKVSAAKTLGIHTLIIPMANKHEVMELNEKLRSDLTFHFVENYKEIFEILFRKQEKEETFENLQTIERTQTLSETNN